jgi:hypothetical protein
MEDSRLVLDMKGKQLSPCIIAKVRYALGINNTLPKNKKTCSVDYWKKVVKRITELEKPNATEEEIKKALDVYVEMAKKTN